MAQSESKNLMTLLTIYLTKLDKKFVFRPQTSFFCIILEKKHIYINC